MWGWLRQLQTVLWSSQSIHIHWTGARKACVCVCVRVCVYVYVVAHFNGWLITSHVCSANAHNNFVIMAPNIKLHIPLKK